MLEAKVDGELIQAGPDSPEVARCPACEGEVHKRRRKVGKTEWVYFYRHRQGIRTDCPLRYRPTK
jgi:hypothetical protein